MRLLLFSLLILNSLSVVAETYNGQIKLERGKFYDDKKPVIEYAGDISYSVKFYVNNFIDKEAIFAHTRVKNLSPDEQEYVFYVAFLDASDNLIATSRHITTLKPGEDTQLGGLYSEVLADEWKKVTKYKFTVTKL